MTGASIYTRRCRERARHRWSIASRTLAAVVGGYVVTSMLSIALPLLLGAAGMSVPQALLGTVTASFPLYAAIIIAVFNAKSSKRVLAWLIGIAALLGLIVWTLLPEAAA